MSYFIDIAHESLNKYGEELCGDKVEVLRSGQGAIVVLADGLGSGVKANILATLTSKIAVTMLRDGADLYETVDTIVNTLPVCKVRNIAYSTFTIVRVDGSGKVYVAEYDNPPFFLLRNGQSPAVPKKVLNINGRTVTESRFDLRPGDVITVVSDGVVHAGIGNVLNLGWQWENVGDYLQRTALGEACAGRICRNLTETCWTLYDGRPGDDATVITLMLKKPQPVNLFTGPPQNPDRDNEVVRSFIEGEGKKIVCGGTTANIVSRELQKALSIDLNQYCPDLPPAALIEGIDLVTEGVLTLSRALEKIKTYGRAFSENRSSSSFKNNDGASRICRILVEEATHLNIWLGRAINPAHQNPDFPMELCIKLKIVEELADIMRGLGKIVNINYV